MDLLTPILDGNNAEVANTNVGSSLPLGRTASNEIYVKVGGIVGTGGGTGGGIPVTSTAPTVTSTNAVVSNTTPYVIPSGSKGWSVTVLTGTATLGSAAALPAGFSDNDSNTLATSLTITAAAASSFYVRYNS